MSWWSFGKKEQKPNFPPEIEHIFGKVASFLDDEPRQNLILPESIRNVMANNGPCDHVPSGVGEFGRSVTNPIPVNGPLGEVLYLSQLATLHGAPIAFHRIGSIRGIDAFETLSFDGKNWDLLYFFFYYTRKSRALPVGYRFTTDQSKIFLFRGTNVRLNSFPIGIYRAAHDCAKQMIDLPFVDNALKALETTKAHRSNEHLAKVRKVIVPKGPQEDAPYHDRLQEILIGIFLHLKAELKKAAFEDNIDLSANFDRELMYAVLYIVTTLLFRNALREDPTSVADRLSMAALREIAEADGEHLGALVEEYKVRFENYREIKFLFTIDEFLTREGGLVLGQHLTARKAAMIFGLRASGYLKAALEPLRDGVTRLGY